MKTSKAVKAFIYIFFISFTFQSTASVENLSALVDLGDYTYESNTKKWAEIFLKNRSQVTTALEAPSKKSTFTIREFEAKKKMTLKANVSSWISDYKSYGFTITDQKPTKLNDLTYGYLIEAFHKKSGKIFKQYMSLKNKKIVTLTCQSSRIDEEFKVCGKMLKSFSWKKKKAGSDLL